MNYSVKKWQQKNGLQNNNMQIIIVELLCDIFHLVANDFFFFFVSTEEFFEAFNDILMQTSKLC